MTVVTQQVMDGDAEDNFDDGHKAWDSVHSRTDKANKRRECIKKLTLSQCVVEHVPDGANTTIALVSIAGISLSKLLLSELQLFCASQKISGYRQKKKQEVAQLIAARVTSDNIYASIGRLGMQKANDSGGDLPRKKPPKYQSKTTRPKAVTKTGSYFRIINLWFSEQNRHLVLATGKKMNRAELDVGGYRHKSIWDNMADQYNNNTGIPAADASDGNKGDNSYLDVIQTPHMLYELENPEDFDRLDGRDVAQFIRWITHQYYVIHKSVSGDHARFEDRVGSKSYLLYFHNMVTATGAENIESLMKAELSRDVFSESSVPGLPATTAHLQETMHGFHTPRSKRIKHKGALRTSNTKEETDNAILRYISTSERDTTESDIASASSTAAKDEYIREKKRMAVEAFDVTMVASMSDAVDTSLKKWRVALQELSSLASGTEFGVNHPIYIATEATVKLYEANFHTLLAQANRVQLNRVDNVAEQLKTSSSSIASNAAGVAENESLAMPPVVLLDMDTIEEDFREDSDNDDEEEWASAAGA
jgi:hypothetical protein